MRENEEAENLNENDPHAGDDEFDDDDRYDALLAGESLPEPPRPINWYLLTAPEAEAEWLDLNQWVDQLRRAYGLPASVVPPFWHRHPELVWELSALHLHWLCSYDPEQAGTGPLAWHKEFAAARARLREWVTTCGTRLERDRPTRQTTWPGESPQDPIEDQLITDRDAEFVEFIAADVRARQDSEDEFLRARIDADESRER